MTFDEGHDYVWQGNQTMIDHVVSEVPRLDDETGGLPLNLTHSQRQKTRILQQQYQTLTRPTSIIERLIVTNSGLRMAMAWP